MTDFQASQAELDKLVSLHAQALLHMQRVGWKVGCMFRIQTGTKRVKRAWYSRSRTEAVYSEMFGASSFGDYYIMRSGTIYGPEDVMRKEGIGLGGTVQLDLARINAHARNDLTEAFEYMLSLTREPVYL